MRVTFDSASGKTTADLSVFHDLTLPVRRTGNVRCYYLDDPEFSFFESPEFSGNLNNGGSVNCEKISMYAHASGTHTECALHVCRADFDIRNIHVPPIMRGLLISVTPEQQGADRVITLNSLSGRAGVHGYDAVLFRTLPGTDNDHTDYSGTNPPYFHPEVTEHLRRFDYKHLLTDLPSVDKESDEGRLSAHKNWFCPGGVADASRTITEFIQVPKAVEDGEWALSLRFPSIQTDAVTSRVYLYPCL